MEAKNGNFSSGVEVLGLSEGGVDWAVDENNASLISPAMEAAVEAARADIIAGKITVHNQLEFRIGTYIHGCITLAR